MDRRTLLELLGRPRRVTVSREVWEVSAILAGLRERANDPIRAADRNRGQDKNWLADIWGVLGEIVALRVVNALTDAPVEHHPIDFDRSVDDVDLVVHLDDGPLRLETKAHLLDPKKRWFMVNARAHARSVARGAQGYVPIMSVLGSSRVLVGSLLTIADLDRWGAPAVALKDPAIGVKLDQLAGAHFETDLSSLTATLHESPVVAASRDLSASAAHAGRQFDLWRRELPPLQHLSASELRDEVLRTRDRVASAF